MSLHDEVTKLVLDRVAQSAAEMSEKATKQLQKKKCGNGKKNLKFKNSKIIFI